MRFLIYFAFSISFLAIRAQDPFEGVFVRTVSEDEERIIEFKKSADCYEAELTINTGLTEPFGSGITTDAKVTCPKFDEGMSFILKDGPEYIIYVNERKDGLVMQFTLDDFGATNEIRTYKRLKD